jgi:hypothetical protein
MPYGYYQFVRFLALIGFSILAYLNYIKNNQIMVVVFGILALLFQPFFKIFLGRDLWNILDVIVGLFLIFSLFYSEKNTPKQTIENNGDEILKK